MDEATFGSKLNELVKEFGDGTNPQQRKLAQLAMEAQDNHKKLQKSIDSLQESLDYLRVCIKYQIFDLEATRRENEYLRKLLEEQTIQLYVDNNRPLNEREINAFVRKLQNEEGIQLSDRILRRLIRNELNKTNDAPPVFDLEYDLVLQKAVNLLKNGEIRTAR